MPSRRFGSQRQLMRTGPALAAWPGVHRGNRVAVGKTRAAGRTHDGVFQVAADIRIRDGLVDIFFLFQCPDLYRPVNMLQIADTTGALRFSAGFCKIRYRNRCKHPDDRHNNHDFDQGESVRVCDLTFHSLTFPVAA
jgi:hypothetical protein